jgi:hypothetical protein
MSAGNIPFRRMALVILILNALAFLCALAGCGGGGGGGVSNSQPPPPPPEINSVSVSPGIAQVITGGTLSFTAQVTGTGAFSSSVTWSVNEINGGNSSLGTIVNGQYAAPTTLPAGNIVTIGGWPRLLISRGLPKKWVSHPSRLLRRACPELAEGVGTAYLCATGLIPQKKMFQRRRTRPCTKRKDGAPTVSNRETANKAERVGHPSV